MDEAESARLLTGTLPGTGAVAEWIVELAEKENLFWAHGARRGIRGMPGRTPKLVLAGDRLRWEDDAVCPLALARHGTAEWNAIDAAWIHDAPYDEARELALERDPDTGERHDGHAWNLIVPAADYRGTEHLTVRQAAARTNDTAATTRTLRAIRKLLVHHLKPVTAS